jgi:hypothetical protein
MPVTARLSLKIYERLGEDVANELVDWLNQVDTAYRTELREINEHNFARFDAKLEHRLAESDARWERRLGELWPPVILSALDRNTLYSTGVSSDVLRRQPDGRWLIAIDNPWGAQVLPAEGRAAASR